MFREIRRSDRLLPVDKAKEFLKSEVYGVLCVLGDDDYPYGVPVNFYYHEKESVIYLHSFLNGHKIDGIKKHPKVCFTIAGGTVVLPDEVSTNYTSVIVFGTAEVLPMENETERQAALEMIGRKYCPENQTLPDYIQKSKAVTNVVKIKIEHMTGKKRG